MKSTGWLLNIKYLLNLLTIVMIGPGPCHGPPYVGKCGGGFGVEAGYFEVVVGVGVRIGSKSVLVGLPRSCRL